MRSIVSVAAALFVALVPMESATSKTAIDEPQSAASQHPLIPAIVAELNARGQAATDPTEIDWISELTGFYAIAGTVPLWVSDGRINSSGEAIIAELTHADDYGLDPGKFALPSRSDPEAVAEVALSMAVVKYIWHAHGGRVDPSQLSLWLDQRPRVIYASTAIRQFVGSADVVATLRANHPKRPEFESLRQALLRARGHVEEPKPAPLVPGPKIVHGERHPDVAVVRERLGIASDAESATLADDDVIEGVRRFMREAGFGKKRRAIDDEVRTALNAAADNAKPRDNAALIEKIIVNMERWRWVPENFGDLHIWNNLPEYESRIVKNGEVILRERIIIGQPSTQTPVFSDAMSSVVFQPTWGVPPSIKIRQFGGRGDISGLLQRRNMRIVDDNGNVIRPSRIKWSKVDIRNVPIVQGPGPGNPLGKLKFLFPNAHDVYMHDTPDKDLFNASARAFSHGCMRLRNPQQYAEIVLRETRGWTPADVARNLEEKDTIKVELPVQIPVHVTYFTAIADAAGKVRLLDDIYGHDRRIAEALAGVPAKKIAARDPALAQLKENQDLARRARDVRRSPATVRAASTYRPRPAQRYVAFKPKPFSIFGNN